MQAGVALLFQLQPRKEAKNNKIKIGGLARLLGKASHAINQFVINYVRATAYMCVSSSIYIELLILVIQFQH